MKFFKFISIVAAFLLSLSFLKAIVSRCKKNKRNHMAKLV